MLLMETYAGTFLKKRTFKKPKISQILCKKISYKTGARSRVGFSVSLEQTADNSQNF